MKKIPCPDFKVGDTVWLEFNGSRRNGGEFTIRKIARKWIMIGRAGHPDSRNDYRFSRDNWRYVDGGDYTSPATVYLNEEEYKEQQEIGRLWAEIRNRICIPDVSLDDMREAARLLGIGVSQ